jgi:hypothetical protein
LISSSSGLRRSFAILALAGMSLVCGGASAPELEVGPPVTILSAEDLRQAGLLFPDGSLGVLRRSDGGYTMFGAGVSVAGLGPGPQVVPPGTYRFEGDLDHLRPDRGAGYPKALVVAGARQRSPDGSDFDRDYAGGGPVYTVDGGKALLQIYHGEHRCASDRGLPAWGGLGMAISRDGGKSFAKLGEIIEPHISWKAFCASGRPGGMWADGTMVEADAEGRPSASGGYRYLVFAEHNDLWGRGELSIARVSKGDFLATIRLGRAPKFLKYYNPSGAPGPVGRFFSEPAIGGRSTPVYTVPGFLGEPGVSYLSSGDKFALVYEINLKRIEFSASQSLFRWPESSPVVTLSPSDSDRLYYPTAVGTGSDPMVLGRQFDVFYLQRTPPNQNPRLQRVTVALPYDLDRADGLRGRVAMGRQDVPEGGPR